MVGRLVGADAAGHHTANETHVAVTTYPRGAASDLLNGAG